MDWKEYVKATIQSFREQFNAIEPELKGHIREYEYDATLLEPCQVEVSDRGHPYAVIWLVTHDQQRKDMEITVHNNIKEPKTYVKKYLASNKYLKHFPQTEVEPLLFFSNGEGYVHLFSTDFWFAPENIGEKDSPEHALLIVHFLLEISRAAVRRMQHTILEETAKTLKKDVASVPEENLRSRLQETSRKIDEAVQQIKLIEEHEQKLKSMKDDLIGVRRLVGTKGFGEWKVLLTEIDKMNTRIDALSDVKNAYNKVLAQQNVFMKQQAEVMKQQSSFVTWIKYATILVPIAVICVPIIEILLRHFLG